MEMVRSLLTDPEIACNENFLFPDGESPTSSPACRWEDVDPKTHKLSDLTSGRWYHETYYLKCHGKEGHVLLPIILYSDKTHTDQRGNLCQEPVLFTLGIFNKRTRQLPRAWRPLGFVPNMQILNQSIKSTQKIDDYHRCLDIILAGLEKAQSHEGLKWDFFYRGKSEEVILVPEVCFVMGDNEAQAKHCAMYQCRSNYGVKCLCRICTVPTHEINRTYDGDKYPWHRRSVINHQISLYIAKKAKGNSADAEAKFLQNCSHHPVLNAWRNISFGWYGIGNINYASPGDILHSNNEGQCHAVEESILACKKANISKALREAEEKKKEKFKQQVKMQRKKLMEEMLRLGKKNETEIDDTEIVVKITEKLDESELMAYRVFSKEVRADVDQMAKNGDGFYSIKVICHWEGLILSMG
jgi:hypothetical protein